MTVSDNEGGRLPGMVYKDSLSPAATAIGTELGRAVRVALWPVKLLFENIEEMENHVETGVMERLSRWRVSPEQVQPAPAQTSLPVMQALLMNPDASLRVMYLNLLAQAMDGRYPARVHPAFVEVLRQLTPLEGQMIGALRKQIDSQVDNARAIPLIGLRSWVEPGSYETRLKHASALPDLPGVDVPRQAIDNLDRLGIVAVHENEALSDDRAYESAKQRPDVIAVMARYEREGEVVSHHTYLAEITDFGYEFIFAVTEPD